MSELTDLIKKQEFRAFLGKPISSLGFGNLARSLPRAILEGVGQGEPLARRLLPELWGSLGSRTAIVSRTGRASFPQLTSRAVRLARGLYDMGLRPGDRVGALLRNEQAWFETMLACMLSGLKMPMLNTHLRPDELVKCINGSRPKVLIFSPELTDVVQQIRPDLETVERFVCSRGDTPSGVDALDDIVAEAGATLPPGGFGMPHMPFSGGSTGVPKFITDDETGETRDARTKGMAPGEMRSLGLKLLGGVSRLAFWGIEETIVSLIPGPLYHAGPQMAVLPLFFGSTIVPMFKFDPEEFLRLIEEERANFTFVAPTMLERVLKLPEDVKGKYDLSSMKVVLCAAAPCPDHVKRDINALFKQQGAGRNVFNEYYGSSEATLITVLRPEDYEANEERYHSVGKPAGGDVRIYDPEQERWCAPGEVGHVVVRNVRMYRVKYGTSDEMDKAFVQIDGAYWYDDGCLGYLDEDDFLYLTSRSKDMIISGGVNIFPPEIENVLKAHPEILDAAVVKVPDEDLGEVPGALIQTVDGKKLSEQEILDFCKNRGLYGFKLPKAIKFTSALPKTPAGKIRKGELEKEFASAKA